MEEMTLKSADNDGPRIRMNLAQSAKGTFQMDFTVEVNGQPDECGALMDETYKSLMDVVKSNGLPLAGK